MPVRPRSKTTELQTRQRNLVGFFGKFSDFTKTVAGGIVATVIFTAAVALWGELAGWASLDKLTFIILLLLVAPLTLLAFHSRKIVDYFEGTSETLISLEDAIALLPARISGVDWKSDHTVHERSIFGKMTDLIESKHITEMRVFSIFKPGAEPTNAEASEAAREYYEAIERAVNHRGMKYQRAVIVRRDLDRARDETVEETKRRDGKAIRAAFQERAEFSAHYSQFRSEPGLIKVYPDDGRIMDIGFALFLSGAKPQALVLEIEIYAASSKGVRGLLIVEPPQPELWQACEKSFSALFRDALRRHFSPREIERLLADPYE